MENQEKVHKRRVRYSGTHPKSYKEKYKEHNPEKYADTIAKVIQKGSTPAGMHISIMVQEILDFLQIKPGMIGLDATLGYGGHTKAMLQKLEGNGHIYALDVDPIESAKTRERLQSQGFSEDILTIRLQNFADIDQVTKDTGKKFDFILADLGVSSMQIDNPDRGFSYKVEGPLDLRIDVNSEFEVLYAFLDKLPEVLAPNALKCVGRFVAKNRIRYRGENIWQNYFLDMELWEAQKQQMHLWFVTTMKRETKKHCLQSQR